MHVRFYSRTRGPEFSAFSLIRLAIFRSCLSKVPDWPISPELLIHALPKWIYDPGSETNQSPMGTFEACPILTHNLRNHLCLNNCRFPTFRDGRFSNKAHLGIKLKPPPSLQSPPTAGGISWFIYHGHCSRLISPYLQASRAQFTENISTSRYVHTVII